MSEEVLKNIPDFTSWEKASYWVQAGQQMTEQFTKELVSGSEFMSLEWGEIERKREFPFGLYASESWRKFVLATFLADLASYPIPGDQVNFDRLLFVMHAFPQGFRTWWLKLPNNSWWPVGYTGWYPMLETMFELFEKSPERLKDRMVVPNIHKPKGQPYLYLFNYSVAPELKKTSLSKALMKRFAQDIAAQNAKGLACITVSDDGIRVANKFGMEFSGNLDVDGSVEGVYIKVRPNQTLVHR